MSEEQQNQWNVWAQHIARHEALELTEGLAGEVGIVTGELEHRVRELEQRVRELEIQLGHEKRIRELENKFAKLSADIDADHTRTGAPLLPLRGGKRAA